MTPQDKFERELRDALRRVEAPEGFADRVLARAESREQHPGLLQRFAGFVHIPVFRFAAAAMLLLAMVGGGLEYRDYEREQRAGEAAKAQLMLALRITGDKIQLAQQKVNAVSSQQYQTVNHEAEKE